MCSKDGNEKNIEIVKDGNKVEETSLITNSITSKEESENVDNNQNTKDEIKEKAPPKKRKKRKRTGYFYEEEEEAFRQFVECEDQAEKDRIFAEKLYQPFTKMIESIIRRYKLFTPGEEFEDTFHDTMSFMITQASKFDFSKGYKVYSYCGTICKNYLLSKRMKATKELERSIPYDNVFNPVKNDMVDEDTEVEDVYSDLIDSLLDSINETLEPENLPKLKDNEIKVGVALSHLLSNWDVIFDSLGSKKFNKSSVLYFLRENTNLTTKEVRDGMKVYKKLYLMTKEEIFD